MVCSTSVAGNQQLAAIRFPIVYGLALRHATICL